MRNSASRIGIQMSRSLYLNLRRTAISLFLMGVIGIACDKMPSTSQGPGYEWIFNKDGRFYCEMLGHDYALVSGQAWKNTVPFTFSWKKPASTREPAFFDIPNTRAFPILDARMDMPYTALPNSARLSLKRHVGDRAESYSSADSADLNGDNIPDYIVHWRYHRYLVLLSDHADFTLQAALPTDFEANAFLPVRNAPFRNCYASIEATAKTPALNICCLLPQNH